MCSKLIYKGDVPTVTANFVGKLKLDLVNLFSLDDIFYFMRENIEYISASEYKPWFDLVVGNNIKALIDFQPDHNRKVVNLTTVSEGKLISVFIHNEKLKAQIIPIS